MRFLHAQCTICFGIISEGIVLGSSRKISSDSIMIKIQDKGGCKCGTRCSGGRIGVYNI